MYYISLYNSNTSETKNCITKIIVKNIIIHFPIFKYNIIKEDTKNLKDFHTSEIIHHHKSYDFKKSCFSFCVHS